MLVARDGITTQLIGNDSGAVVSHTLRSLLLVCAMASVVACAPARTAAYQPARAVEATQGSPVLTIKKDLDLVRLEGVLGSAQQAAQLTEQAAELFGAEMIINDIKLDPSLDDAQWLDTVLLVAEKMQYVEEFSLTASSGLMTVGGTVDSEATANQLSGMASDLAGLTLAVSSTLSYPIAGSASQDTGAVAVADMNSDTAVSDNGISIPVVPIALLEQQAVALQQAAMPAVPAVAVAQTQEPAIVVPASMRPSNPVATLDSDGDGLVDAVDACDSRPGYPVNDRGCSLLDGYLKDVRFYGDSDQLTEAAKGSLDMIAFTMLDNPASKIAVLSYSKDGSPSLTRAQARKRAYLVVDYLVAKGVNQNRLQAFALAHRRGVPDQIMIKEVD